MRDEFGNKYKGEGYVSTWDDGSLIQPDYLAKQFYRVCEEIGLERIRFHDLRHSAASMLLAEGFGLKEVSEFLGHCDIGTTANIYGHLQYQSKVNMGTRMNEMLLAPDEPEDELENEIA